MDWISVKHSLPPIDLTNKWNSEEKISRKVLIYFQDTKKTGLFLIGVFHRKYGEFWVAQGFDLFEQHKVTHWMNISKPNKNIKI